MRSFLALVPAVALSLATFACSGSDPSDPIDDDGIVTQQSQLVDEGRECSAAKKCKAGLACVARVKGGDVGIKGVPMPCENEKDCGGTSSSSSSGTGSTTSSSGASGTSGSSGWSSSTSSTSGASGTSGWSSSSTSSTGGTSGWSSSTSSSSGSTPEVGVCITVR